MWRYGSDRLRADVATAADWKLPALWHPWIRWAIPLQAGALLVWWGWQATTPGFLGEDGRWYDPFNPFSLMTGLVQWGAALLILILANGWMSRRVVRGATAGEGGGSGDSPDDLNGGLSAPNR